MQQYNQELQNYNNYKRNLSALIDRKNSLNVKIKIVSKRIDKLSVENMGMEQKIETTQDPV
jgi:predicted  nucleic acid-binding Zn-ribbon protein